MPGVDDPANASLPQQVGYMSLKAWILVHDFVLLLIFFSFQPLNRCLFPGSSVYNTFRSCTNPHSFDLDEMRYNMGVI